MNMENGIAMIVVALVTTVGAVIVAVIQLFKKESRGDHALVLNELRFVNKSLGRVEDKVDDHLVWHSEGQNEHISRRSEKPQRE